MGADQLNNPDSHVRRCAIRPGVRDAVNACVFFFCVECMLLSARARARGVATRSARRIRVVQHLDGRGGD